MRANLGFRSQSATGPGCYIPGASAWPKSFEALDMRCAVGKAPHTSAGDNLTRCWRLAEAPSLSSEMPAPIENQMAFGPGRFEGGGEATKNWSTEVSWSTLHFRYAYACISGSSFKLTSVPARSAAAAPPST
jgi:hypothetical protein